VARLLVAAGLPEPTFEHVIRLASGLFVARVDLAYPPALLAIECDSDKWRSGRQRRQADLERQNRLIIAGWTLLRFTWDHLVNQPHLVVAQVRGALDHATV
jgi:very-short-patch-repair endonuclease